jgi:hypothetical protein
MRHFSCISIGRGVKSVLKEQQFIEARKTKPGFIIKSCIKHLFLLPALSAGIHQAAGQSALWKYKAIYHQGDDRVGRRSDVVSIPVAG